MCFLLSVDVGFGGFLVGELACLWSVVGDDDVLLCVCRVS